MSHDEFVAAYRAGKLTAHVDPKAAARLVSGQMMLPLVMLPVFGIAVALAIAGHFITGAALFVAALAFRYAVRRSSPGFVLRRSLEDAVFYRHVTDAGVLTTART